MRLNVLGPFQARSAVGDVVRVSGRQAALVALLVAGDTGWVSADELVEGLGGSEATLTLNSLQALVSRTRRAIGSDTILSERGGYRLALPTAEVDAWAFEALMRSAGSAPTPDERRRLLREAVALWSGTRALAGVYPEWCDCERLVVASRSLSALRAGAVAGLVDDTIGDDELGEVVVGLHAAHHDDPFDERIAEALMRALYTLGRPNEALKVWERVRAHLVESGLEPMPELAALASAVLRHDRAQLASPRAALTGPDPTRTTAMPTADRAWRGPPTFEVPFVGRSGDVATVRTAMQAGTLVVITGAAGIGKSRLAIEAAAGRPTAFVRFRPGNAPLEPWVRSFPAVWAVVSDSATTGLSATAAISQVARAVAGGASAGTEPALLLLDDLHHADSASFDVLEELRDAGLRAVATWVPDGTPGDDRLRRLIASGAHMYELDGMGRTDLAALAAAHAWSGDIDALVRATNGNAFLATIVLSAGQTPDGDGWSRAVTTSAATLIDAELARAEGQRPLLDIVALAEGPIGLEVLSALDGVDGSIDTVSRLVRVGLLSELAGGEPAVELIHDLLRSRVVELVPGFERQRGHALLADAYERVSDARTPSVTVARHWLSGPTASRDRARPHLERAVPEFLRFGQVDGAWWAVRELEAIAVDGGSRARSALAAGLTHAATGRPGEARPHFEDAIRLGLQADDLVTVASAAVGLAGPVTSGESTVDDATELVRLAADPRLGAAPGARARLLSRAVALDRGRSGSARAWADAAVRSAGADGGADVGGAATHAAILATLGTPGSDRRLALASAALDAGGLTDPVVEIALLVDGARAALEQQLFDVVAGFVERARDGAFATSSPLVGWWVMLLDGIVSQAVGDHERALRLADDACAHGSAIEIADARVIRGLARLSVAWNRGTLAELADRYRRLDPTVLPPILLAAQAVTTAAAGDAASAFVALEQLGSPDLLPRDYLWNGAVELALEAARLVGSPTEPFERALHPFGDEPTVVGSCFGFLVQHR